MAIYTIELLHPEGWLVLRATFDTRTARGWYAELRDASMLPDTKAVRLQFGGQTLEEHHYDGAANLLA